MEEIRFSLLKNVCSGDRGKFWSSNFSGNFAGRRSLKMAKKSMRRKHLSFESTAAAQRFPLFYLNFYFKYNSQKIHNGHYLHQLTELTHKK